MREYNTDYDSYIVYDICLLKRQAMSHDHILISQSYRPLFLSEVKLYCHLNNTVFIRLQTLEFICLKGTMIQCLYETSVYSMLAFIVSNTSYLTGYLMNLGTG